MTVLALLIAFLLSLTIFFFLTIHVQAHYRFQNMESYMLFSFKVLVFKLRIEVTIPKDMLAIGFLNILINYLESTQGLDVIESTEGRKKVKTRRYKFVRNISSKILRHYIFSWSRLLYIKRSFTKIYRRFLRKITVHSLQADVKVGAGDAAETGLLIGAFWTALGQMKARLFRIVTIEKDHIRYAVTPNFQTEMFLCKLNCIFSLKISHIIFTAYKFLLVIFKLRRIRNYG